MITARRFSLKRTSRYRLTIENNGNCQSQSSCYTQLVLSRAQHWFWLQVHRPAPRLISHLLWHGALSSSANVTNDDVDAPLISPAYTFPRKWLPLFARLARYADASFIPVSTIARSTIYYVNDNWGSLFKGGVKIFILIVSFNFMFVIILHFIYSFNLMSRGDNDGCGLD